MTDEERMRALMEMGRAPEVPNLERLPPVARASMARPQPAPPSDFRIKSEEDEAATLRAEMDAKPAKEPWWGELIRGIGEGAAYGQNAPIVQANRRQEAAQQKQMEDARRMARLQELGRAPRQRQADSMAMERFKMEQGESADTRRLRQLQALREQQALNARPEPKMREVIAEDGSKRLVPEEPGMQLAPPEEAQEPAALATYRLWESQQPEGTATYEGYLRATQGQSQARPDYEWVIRGGQPLQIQKGTAKPGDRPYDAVAERKQPGDTGPSEYSKERMARTVASVDDLVNKVNSWTVGYGSMLAGIPESKARNFRAELDTLKANIAFNELTAMREASKTGGALGQVSNVELGLLQSALGALDTAQSPEQFKAQLQKIKESVTRWQEAAERVNQGVGNEIDIAPNSPRPGGMQPGSTKTYQGATYVFDGKQWVKQ